MSQFNAEWTVGPHGAIETVDEGLISVAGEIVMPLGRFPRRMTAVRLKDGGVVIWSAIALDDAGMAELEAFGAPRFLIVPNAGHRLDARLFKDRYPGLTVVAPEGSHEAVEAAVPVDATEDVFGDPGVRFVTVAGTAAAESALIVTRSGGTTLITNDIIGHVTHPHGLGANVMTRLFDYGVHEPSIPRTIRRFIKDKAALAAQMRDWAALPDLKRIIVSHVDPITDAPAEHLRRLADELDD
ncbi:hypothetical protein [Brevundimonas goettingensis]|uniref:Uncharacterized protein n=1 Tax=Brevundimonas goettingensis TaxID=2774190 RepID=A0A975GVP2_9CAUL|nr:hypothetical protein [Brevundimonas goettingensis]QTC90878.1 hypothetical protein IFJ75_16880 [Brevundimonas goettingensis]